MKKTSRTAKSTAPDSVTPVEKASGDVARRARPAAKAVPKADATADGPKPKVARVKRPANATAIAAVPSQPNGAPATTVEAAPVMVPGVITDEDIRVRAYFLSIEHRGQGSAEYFWHLAERQLRGMSR